MSTAAKINIMRRKRNRYLNNIQAIQECIDNYQQTNKNDDCYLEICQAQLEEEWKRFRLVQEELKGLGDRDYTQQCKAVANYMSLNDRIRELMESKRPLTPSTPKCSSNTSSSIQGSNNNLNKNSNDIQTPPTENIVSNLSPIPSHDTCSSLHNIRSSSPTRDLTTTMFALSQQSDLTPPNSLNRTNSNDSLDLKKEIQRSSATMANATELNSLCRERSNLMDQFTVVSKLLDEYEQCGHQDKPALLLYENQLNDAWNQFNAIHSKLVDLDEEEYARLFDITNQYHDIVVRIKDLIERAQPASPSKPTNGESATVFKPTSIELPEINLPTFNGAIEDWHYFYDIFSSIIDQNERLTPVQKFHYLRLCLTGKAARSIRSLKTTHLNYSIAIDILKEKFGCHAQICMRHWHLISEYPKIIKETPEAVDDFLETVKVNLWALEKLGEPITSNVVLIELIASKLPSSTIRDWYCTLPNKRMPPYTHLIDFLRARTN